ncbi:MAG: hypothetical protein OJF59_002982 [Cytophagales bacterium]|jgi:hypothetical protein|nr:hypothetical protein [Bacteroidota bacterium]MBS1979573.1 hypothetical protein [Bacteroidota bacterium]WHZ09226.1 MAG: hypothetical protein OJF59_002982 [Cytophagales bacterium]
MAAVISKRSDIVSPQKKIQVGVDLLASVDPLILEDSYIYVHCSIDVPTPGLFMRIWKTTVLRDCHSRAKATLIHAENISYAPVWTHVLNCEKYPFLLIFSALPRTCSAFDLIEDIPQPGGFAALNIARNQSDVYHIHLA